MWPIAGFFNDKTNKKWHIWREENGTRLNYLIIKEFYLPALAFSYYFLASNLKKMVLW